MYIGTHTKATDYLLINIFHIELMTFNTFLLCNFEAVIGLRL